MSEIPKRRFWQIHLSTAVLAMLSMGVILLIIFTPHQSTAYTDSFNPDHVQGWPLETQIRILQAKPYVAIVNPIKPFGIGYDFGRVQYHEWPSKSAILVWILPDFVMVLGVISILAAIFELFIHRNEARRL